MKFIRRLLLLVIIACVAYMLIYTDILSKIEREAPVLADFNVPDSIGAKNESIKIEVTDEGAGISSFILSLKQNDKTIVIDSVEFKDPVKSYKSEPVINELNKSFKEGKAELLLQLNDASYWNNSLAKSFQIKLDFSKPILSILSRQHVASQGGTEFVLLKAEDSSLKKVGVRVGNYEFKGVHAKNLDEDFSNTNVFAVLFALPLEIDSPSPIAFAEDAVGNTSTAPIIFRIKKRQQKLTNPNVSDQFVYQKVKPLFDEYLNMLQEDDKPSIDNSDVVSIFKVVNEDYRSFLQAELASLPLENKALSQGTFIKPMASATTSNFGESRSYTVNGETAGGSRHDGLDLASVKHDSVVAANDGTVILSRHFGIYGNTVVIDHGMGLSSLYGHLSSLSVKTGDQVKKGQELGRSGTTGLAGGDHLHFEFRIGDAPVTPTEWWDSHWIEDNITGKLKDIKEDLN